MELTDAAKMLAGNHFNSSKKEVWADLGCGSGTFTLALAGLLKAGSKIYAVDTNPSALSQMPAEYDHVTIETSRINFEMADLNFEKLDGILMANSLHYVRDKKTFIQKATSYLKDDGHFLLVEYDIDKANQWVPYPLSFSSLIELFTQMGFNSIRKLEEKPSLFRRANIYSAIIGR